MLACLILPPALKIASQGYEAKTERDAPAARDVVWQKDVTVRLGPRQFTLPFHPDQQWVYQGASWSLYGAKLQRPRDRQAVDLFVSEQPSPVIIGVLILRHVDIDCVKNGNDRETQEYCGGIGLPAIDAWCALNPEKSRKPWCDKGIETRRFEVRFISDLFEDPRLEDGQCLKGRCYARTDISLGVEAIVIFDGSSGGEYTDAAKIYAKQLWAEIVEAQY